MDTDEKMIRKIRDALNEAPTEQSTRRQLAGIRKQVLEQADATEPLWWLPIAKPLLIAATIGFLALVIILRIESPAPDLQPDLTVADFEMLSGSDELEMFENLEFYLWLEEQQLEQAKFQQVLVNS